jgi:hypothetical protein
MFRGMFRQLKHTDGYEWGSFKLTRYEFEDGGVEYTLSADGFAYIPLNQQEMDDLLVFLNTLRDDEVI